MKLRCECSTCKIYIDLPLDQFKKNDAGGLFIDNLSCVNCNGLLKKDLMFE